MAVGVSAAWLCFTLALAVVWCWPIANVSWFATHEAVDYVVRTVEYAASLSQGELYPRWAPDLYSGYGAPFFNFHAPAVYWLSGALTCLFVSPVVALKLVVLGAGLLAGASSFALIRHETGRDDAAFVGSALYVCAPYRLGEVTLRGDLAELLALGVLPLVLLLYRRIALEPQLRRLPSLTLAAVLAHAALVLSHTLLGLWGTGLAAVVALASSIPLWRRRDFSRAPYLVLAFACALLASSFYTAPALLEKGLVRTEAMTVGKYATENNLFELAQLFSREQLELSTGTFRIGPLALGALALILFGALSRRRVERTALSWLLAGLGLLLLTLSISKPLWTAQVIPFGSYIQFPWRVFGPASLCFAAAFGIAWAHAFPSRLISGLLALYPVLAAIYLALPLCNVITTPIESVPLSSARVRRSQASATLVNEYLPRAVQPLAYELGAPVASSSEALHVTVEQSRGTRHVLAIDARAPGALELRLHDFPGWQARTLTGAPALELRQSPHGLVSLWVPAPGRYRVAVKFGTTPLRRTVGWLSLSALLAVLPLAQLLARRETHGVAEQLRELESSPT